MVTMKIQILLFILMILPMMTNAAGGAMAQDRSQNRSQARPQKQLFNNRKIDGLDYRVFTWINTDFTHSLTQRLQMSWRGQIVTANMRAHYQYDWVKNPNSDNLSQFHNWEVWADITVRPVKGWLFSTNGFYRSKTRSLYRNTKDTYSISARIAKEFKRFTVYLEG